MSKPLPSNAGAATTAAPKKAETSKEKFLEQFNNLSDAAVGVFFTHAREPHRVQTALREWSFVNNHAFREWDALHGWRTYPDDPEKPPTSDNLIDPVKALKQIMDLEGGGKKPHEGVFLFHWPHFYVDKIPTMMQCLKHYSREFTNEPLRRLVLLVPEGAKLPKEIEHDVVQLDLGLPTRQELREVYNNVMRNVFNDAVTHPFKELEVQAIVDVGAGMTETEFEVSVSKAIIENRDTFPKTPLNKFLAVVSKSKTAVVQKSDVLELMPAEDMSNVGGMEILKEWIQLRKQCFTQEARDFGVDMPKGMVAIGPPGTGKSLMAKAVAHELGLPLIKFDVSKVYNSLVGESEARVRAALKQLEAIAPAVVLVDEVDKGLGGSHQAGGDSGVSKRILGAILTFMQENQLPIFWVMTANRTDGLPPEMLRKGRLDEVWALLPPNPTERLAVLKIHLRKRKQTINDDADLLDAVTASEGFVSAEIEAAVKEAVTVAFSRKIAVDGALIKEQLGTMKPISVAFKEDFDRMQKWAAENARAASVQVTPARARGESPPAEGGTPKRAIKVGAGAGEG